MTAKNFDPREQIDFFNDKYLEIFINDINMISKEYKLDKEDKAKLCLAALSSITCNVICGMVINANAAGEVFDIFTKNLLIFKEKLKEEYGDKDF